MVQACPVNSKTSVMIFWRLVKEFQINYSSVMAKHINYILKTSKKLKNHNLFGLFCGGAKLEFQTFKLNLKIIAVSCV